MGATSLAIGIERKRACAFDVTAQDMFMGILAESVVAMAAIIKPPGILEGWRNDHYYLHTACCCELSYV